MGNSENGKKNVKNKISMDQFVDHFKNLISNDNVDNGQIPWNVCLKN